MKYTLYIFLFLIVMACGDTANNGNGSDTTQTGATDSVNFDNSKSKVDTGTYDTYVNQQYLFEVKLPPGWRTAEQGDREPIINLYSAENKEQLKFPLTFHSDAMATHVTFFPNGLGTEAPSGGSIKLSEWGKSVPVDFNLDKTQSIVYLLNNGDPWGYMLRLRETPDNWGEYGMIFAQVKVNDFSTKCFDKKTGEELTMEKCDALMGDKVVRYGKVSGSDHERVMRVLQSISFFDKGEQKKDISDLIRVKTPKSNEDISSPLTIKGEARGFWFFEASFSVELQDKDYNIITTEVIQAQGDWMTEDFVPFEASFEFSSPGPQKGYLVFRKANASGLPKHDRAFRVPVILR